MKWSERDFLWQPGNISHHFGNLHLLIVFLRQALCFPQDQSLDPSYKQLLNLGIAHTRFLLCHKVPRHSVLFFQQDDFSFYCFDHTTPLHSHYRRFHISWLSLFRCLRMRSFRHDRYSYPSGSLPASRSISVSFAQKADASFQVTISTG